MEYYTLLVFGCLVGMQHALEADHLAAVAAMSAGRTSQRALVLRGGFWGLGHTLTVLSICGVLLVFGGSVSARMEAGLELIVAVMLLSLGFGVLRKLWRQRPHFHFHRHDDGVHHIHPHVHSGQRQHARSPHEHEHHDLGLGRAVVIGMLHGAAGSAGLLVLAAAAESLMSALGYVVAFSAGTILGMAALSFVASYPLALAERCAGWLNATTTALIGGVALVIGGRLLVQSWAAL